MTEVTENFLPVQQEERLLIENSSELLNSPSNLTSVANDSSDEENARTPGWGVRRRIKRFSDSDSDDEADKENIQNVAPLLKEITSKPNSSSESDEDIIPRKSRILNKSGSSEDSDRSKSPRLEESRIGNKRNKLHQKFKGLLKSRSKDSKAPEIEKAETSNKLSEGNGSSSSDSSSSGIASIKKKINQKSMILKSGICDPDTSSDEDGRGQLPEQKKKKPKQRSTILISPKPARMSAKQAMENMQKIKSESNRMLREKEVSLPYHRSKALSLKDIMSRRKLAVSADGKALPLKMNSDQLTQYVKLLEQRNKEMMELCKSDTEDEEVTEAAQVPNTLSNADDCKDSGAIGIIEDQLQDNTELPEVNLTERIKEDDELPDLTVEIVQKEHDNLTDITVNNDDDMKEISDNSLVNSEFKVATEDESQLIELHYGTDKTQNTETLDSPRKPDVDVELNKSTENVVMNIDGNTKSSPNHENPSDSENLINEKSFENDNFSDDFSDTDINMEDLDKIIENAKNITSEDTVNSPMLIRDFHSTNLKPKLTGAPGMVIDLDGSNPVGPKKRTGVELLKERFTYFAKLKTPEEMERERELKLKPGMQHLKLRQELEEQISEQRSLEWAKRLADEKQHQLEMDAIRGDESDQEEIEKIEAQLEEKEDKDNVTSESEEEVEEICDEIDKPRQRNPMIDDEAEVSGDDDGIEEQEAEDKVQDGENNGDSEEIDSSDDDEDQDNSEESSDDTSEDEDDKQSKPRKGRILKAFEDSDDESTTAVQELSSGAHPELVSNVEINEPAKNDANETQYVKYSQDDVLPLAQTNKTNSEDFFASQASNALSNGDKDKLSDKDSSDLGTQTFSILNPNTSECNNYDNILNVPDKLDIISETQPVGDVNLDDVVGMCSGKFTQTQNLIQSESQITQSQCVIGDDILELCTGNFYENKFVTQTQIDDDNEITKEKLRVEHNVPKKKLEEEKDLLDSILKEMEQPAAVNEAPKSKKYMFDNANTDEPVSFDVVHQIRKKFIIDSDDEGNEATNPIKKKKLKKRKPEKRALQISDDEEEEEQLVSDEDAVDDVSDVDDDGEERIVEYDSEENEVVVKPQNQKKKRKMTEFFEQEAELTSEDEWVGSGDEDEAGLDRMEREAGDDDTFHEGQLQRELGQIHMRDVLDQDKREVRLIQELLFEDGDLGEGHRQRKFRWKNLDGEEETDAVPDMFGESQEEEFESEEQWRKQRHEREMFLRSLKEENETEDHKISINRSTIIKANLCSKTMSSLLLEVNGGKIEETTVVEMKVAKDDPVPAATLSVFPQSYHGSLLTRGRGALARLAALAVPLAGDADDARAAGPSAANRNFVFTSVTPDSNKPKVAKRKAEDSGTPKLIKKLKTDGKQKFSKNSLLDHLKVL